MPRTTRSLCRDVIDLLVFLTTVVTAWRARANAYPGVPSLLETILRDATLYFVVIFGCQLTVEMFSFFAPVGGTRHV